MPDRRRRRCKSCRRHESECGAMSWTGLCTDCAKGHVNENLEGLVTKTGPALERWRRGMAACVGASFLDAGASSPHTPSDA